MHPAARVIDLILACAAVAAFSAAVNLASYVSELSSLADVFGRRLIASRGMPSYTNATNISATYAIFFVGSAAVVAYGARWRRVAAACVATVLFAAMLATQSRSALLGAAAGLLVLCLVGPPRVKWTAAASIGIVGGAIVLVPELWHTISYRGFSFRPELWSLYSDMALNSPIIGFGARADLTVALPDGRELEQAHNLLLNAQLRGGALAAVAMLYVMVGGAFWAGRLYRRGGSVAPLCMIVAMIVFSQFDYALLITPPTWPWVTFWFPIGLCLGAEVLVREKDPLHRRLPRRHDRTDPPRETM